MTEHEKRSLQYRLARRFDLDPRRIMEIIREEIKKSPLTEEPLKGKWKAEYKGGRKLCSNCGIFNFSKYKNFCPNCGADMRGSE